MSLIGTWVLVTKGECKGAIGEVTGHGADYVNLRFYHPPTGYSAPNAPNIHPDDCAVLVTIPFNRAVEQVRQPAGRRS